MTESRLNRREFIGVAAAGLGAIVLPSAAIALPSLEEIANESAVTALGNPQGSVTLVELVDYQCPYCKICYREIAKLVAEDADIRLVIRDWPIFGGVSIYAARAMVAVSGDRNYPAAVAAMMANNRYLTERRINRILGEAGIAGPAVGQRIAAGQPEVDELLYRTNDQARALGLKGTPGLLVGQVLYRHGLGVEKLRRAVAFVRTGEGTYPT
jgi:protein-disulfide isomerase